MGHLNSLHAIVSHLVDDGLQCLKVGEIIILNAFVAIQELSFTILCTQKMRAKYLSGKGVVADLRMAM